MTPAQRLQAARTEIADLLVLATPGSHDQRVLQLHDQVLARADPWLLGRLGRGGLLTELINGLLDLYAPEPVQTTPATTRTKEAHA